jgi:hypothetical protein
MRGGGSHRGAGATGTETRQRGKARGVALRAFTRTWRRERNFWRERKRLEVSSNVENGDAGAGLIVWRKQVGGVERIASTGSESHDCY